MAVDEAADEAVDEAPEARDDDEDGADDAHADADDDDVDGARRRRQWRTPRRWRAAATSSTTTWAFEADKEVFQHHPLSLAPHKRMSSGERTNPSQTTRWRWHLGE